MQNPPHLLYQRATIAKDNYTKEPRPKMLTAAFNLAGGKDSAFSKDPLRTLARLGVGVFQQQIFSQGFGG